MNELISSFPAKPIKMYIHVLSAFLDIGDSMKLDVGRNEAED